MKNWEIFFSFIKLIFANIKKNIRFLGQRSFSGNSFISWEMLCEREIRRVSWCSFVVRKIKLLGSVLDGERKGSKSSKKLLFCFLEDIKIFIFIKENELTFYFWKIKKSIFRCLYSISRLSVWLLSCCFLNLWQLL